MAINTPYPVIDVKKTGNNIRQIREAQHISVAEVQRYLGLQNPQAIYQWQRGINLPSVDHLCALSHLFDVPMDDIIVLTDTQESAGTAKRRIVKRIPLMAKRVIFLTAA